MKVNLDFIHRKKKYDSVSVEASNLSRVLNLFDLSNLGVSCTLGSGIYVLAGTVISQKAGPSVIISFMIAGIASFLAGLCYAELGSRVPRSGSAYVYIYVTIGEYIAFLIGWDVILEYVIGTSSTASALSKYIDGLCDGRISTALENAMPMNAPLIASYPDFLGAGLTIVITIFLIIGVKESSILNSIFTVINLIIILFIIIAGSTKATGDNWKLSPNENTIYLDINGNNISCSDTNPNLTSSDCGKGGFAPFGFNGIIRGAATCFYAFIGFDCIATTGEEVRNAKRTIPIAIITTLVIVALSYISVSTVLSLMMPYYALDPDTPFTMAFNYVGLSWATYVVNVGAIISLATCLYSSMYPMPRVVYSMASDALIFKWLAWIAPRLSTPTAACIFTGLLAALCTLLFNLEELIEMLSIGTLLAYALVSSCTLVLRYRPFVYEAKVENRERTFISKLIGESDENIVSRLLNHKNSKCNQASAHLVNALGISETLAIIFLNIVLVFSDLTKIYSYVFIAFFAIIIIFFAIIIWRQPQNPDITTFKVPFMPFIPLLSIFVNIYLMLNLKSDTWLRLGVWLLIGFVMYFGYGIRKSKERIITGRQNKIFPCFETSYEEPKWNTKLDAESGRVAKEENTKL